MSKEEERALWNAAVALLDSNASPASVGVVKMSPECNKMQACNKTDKEAA